MRKEMKKLILPPHLVKLSNCMKNFDIRKIRFKVKKIMRHNDVGDYYGRQICSYDLKNRDFINAIFLHEFVEYLLILSAGLNSKDVDKLTEKDNFRSPMYYKYVAAHNIALAVERQFIENLGYNWELYDKFIQSVFVEARTGPRKERKR
jgi:hypothetical protein